MQRLRNAEDPGSDCQPGRPLSPPLLPAATSGKRLFLLPSGTGSEEQEAATEAALQASLAAAGGGGSGGVEEGQLVSWQRRQEGGGSGGEGGLVVLHKFGIKNVTWHARGDYFATVAPTGNTQVRWGWSAPLAVLRSCLGGLMGRQARAHGGTA